MILRSANISDTDQISALLKELTTLGKRTSPDSPSHVRDYYLNDPAKISCTLAQDGDVILGFQSLKRAEPGNKWGVTPGWGIIGTHIRPAAARRGVGRALFDVTRQSARDAGLLHIDASIAAHNAEGLGYYSAIGFREYRAPKGLICKRYDVT